MPGELEIDTGKEVENVLLGSERREITMGNVSEDVLLGSGSGKMLYEFALLA